MARPLAASQPSQSEDWLGYPRFVPIRTIMARPHESGPPKLPIAEQNPTTRVVGSADFWI